MSRTAQLSLCSCCRGQRAPDPIRWVAHFAVLLTTVRPVASLWLRNRWSSAGYPKSFVKASGRLTPLSFLTSQFECVCLRSLPTGNTGATLFTMYINGVLKSYMHVVNSHPSNSSTSAVYYMNVGDYAYIKGSNYHWGPGANGNDYPFFSGYLLG